MQKFIADLNSAQLSDENVMEKYGLNHLQMVFVMGKLAEKRKINFKRIVLIIRRYIELEELGKAEACLKVLRKYFCRTWGIQAIVRSLELELVSLKSQREFHRKIEKESKSIEWFKSEFPGISLHPAVVFSVKVLDYHFNKMADKEKADNPIYSMLDARRRLKIYPQYLPTFSRYDSIEATWLWHYISLKLFAQEKIKHFVIRGMMDADTRDVCMYLDGTRLSVNTVLLKAIEQNVSGDVLRLNHFPSLMEVEDLSPEQRAGFLLENGWYLPPFCENCRCQIFPG